MATPSSFAQQLAEVEAMASASSGRQDMLAGNMIETRETVKEIKERLEVHQRSTESWHKVTDARMDIMEGDIRELKTGITKLGHEYVGITQKVGSLAGKVGELNTKYERLDNRLGDLNTKYERLDNKVADLARNYKALDDRVGVLDTKVDALDGKVGLLTEDVGGLKAGQIELRDMVATLLARSEGVGNPN